ncbi:MCE family protein [Streptacidiphilus monticola]|uniref:MCE family protein n=1 Tax=Streptacidiphilus monticola TaxID=2161674 RepID=A0ABW1GAS0_9ACTN
MTRRLLHSCCLLLATALGAAGCSSGYAGLQDVPLPGGADLGSHPYQVTAQFADVLSLVPQAAVRVDDVAVGRVTDISLTGDGSWNAVVTMEINGSVRLPADAYASLQQSSLLGEKYVALSGPPAGRSATGVLADHDVIPLSRTNRSAEVEEVFGSLSLLLNGGGMQQLKTISTELNEALAGNEPEVRDLLGRMRTLVGQLDGHRADLTAALDGVNRLSVTLAQRDQQLGDALDRLSPGLKVLDQQRGRLVTMLQALDTLSTVAVDTVNRSQADMVADLRALAPSLRRLADAGRALPQSLQVLLTYPFTDQVLNGVKGDYLNTYLTLAAAPATQVIPALLPQDSIYPQPVVPLVQPQLQSQLQRPTGGKR